jgi:hypothetical protein
LESWGGNEQDGAVDLPCHFCATASSRPVIETVRRMTSAAATVMTAGWPKPAKAFRLHQAEADGDVQHHQGDDVMAPAPPDEEGGRHGE